MSRPLHITGDDLPDVYVRLVPCYQSAVYSPFVMEVDNWTNEYGERIAREVSAKRATNRCNNYLDPAELMRVAAKLQSKGAASIRFGVQKTGRGYHGERGDFCLVAGAIDGRKLTLMYRSLELIGGFGYDLCLIARLSQELEWEPKRVTILAAKANVFALRGNSNEKFYPKLRRILT